MHTRYAIVGTGSRAEMFTRALTGPHRDTCALVALADPEPHRLAVHNARLPAPVPTYPATEFRRMLHEEKVDVAIVTTVDRVHDEYIVAALEAGCDVLTEKPMTVDAQRCARILDAVRRTGRRVRVTFNYRYNPFHETFKRLIAEGEIGEVGSVHFEWLLDVRHGADYFRRWHRAKANSGGLLVHKSGHHFDLVNWWLDDDPVSVYAQGRLFFYGSEGTGATAPKERFALGEDPHRDVLYTGTGDGYRRDQDVFAPGITIEDDLAVLVRYARGATMTYHLTAYAPWEGYRVMVNGSKGRLELEVVETDHVAPGATGLIKGDEPGRATLRVHPHWSEPREIPIPYEREGHGGGDARMLADLLGAGPPSGVAAAEAADGARALRIGLAANESIASGLPVRIRHDA
ncbi:Gfo/Idh/MocA family protein [Dactylosporangium siamense]|uniref:Dehydrogenase n=1 Tax=Dactylosporangium siamense TaxID=685454 RepID=A0A919PHR7_9ACTN|nr:Gfo/Idh/MocA family oxidoreductase [Dactylosporangium siamense]GIG42800.1 dehydrogenase [Dactylosporangium siamense]